MLSVVVPIYNVASTLCRCVESLLFQGLEDIEIILVNDGSTDNSPTLCDKWGASDTRIRVIHKSNGGLSDARNAGIKLAQGEYITFVDPDDYLAPNTYQLLIEYLRAHPQVDILEYPVHVNEGTPQAYWLRFDDHIYSNVSEYWYDTEAWTHAYAWNKIYKKQLFDTICFPKGKKFEDMHTFPLLLLKSCNIATTSVGAYHYCFNPKGICALADGEAYTSLLQACLCTIQMERFALNSNERYYLYLVNLVILVHEITGVYHTIPTLYFRTLLTTKTRILNLLGVRAYCIMNRFWHGIFPR